MKWSKALVRELSERRCVIFLGAGASAGSRSADGKRSPPDWETFLKRLMSKMSDAADKAAADLLIHEKRYLDAAEVIRANVNDPDFAQFIRDELALPKYTPSAVHEAVLEIDPKIVITTNYDSIYESFCLTGGADDGYNVCRYYETHLVSDLRSPVRLIVKAHGCLSDSAQIVLTRSDYFEQRRLHEKFFQILNAVFVTNTLLFIGYSLSDPDIQLLLENTHIATSRAHPHYAVIPNDAHSALKRAWSNAYNIEFIEFPAGDYGALNDGLRELVNDVLAFREIHI